jgi:hypothetical protein
VTRRRVLIIAALLAAGLLLDLAVGAETIGYAAGLGLAGCVVIILVSKWIGKVWLQRPADYYEREPDA